MQGLVNQPGTGVIPFQAARTTTDVQLLSNVAANSYVYSNEAVQVGNVVAPPVGIDQYTKLMLHMDGTNASTTFTDSEILAKTVTAYGNAQISTAQSVFGGASAYFDGTGDYIDTPDSEDFNVGAGDFTIDFWCRRGSTGYSYICGQCSSDGLAANMSVYIGFNSGNVLEAYLASGSTLYTVSSPSAYTSSTIWYHVAMIRYGNTLSLYVDGTSVASRFVTGVTVNNSAYKFTVGRQGEYPTAPFNGYIDEFRFSKGIARWTSNFTPPTQSYALPGIDSYTKLALHMDGADSSTTFTDSCAVPKTVTRYGDAQIKTAQSKFGGASGYFDGTGDYLTLADSTDWDFGTGDFTADCWVNFSASGSGITRMIIGGYQDASNYMYLLQWRNNTLWLEIYTSGTARANYTIPFTPTLGTWYHIAVVRNGSSCAMYVNGTAGSLTTTTAFNGNIDFARGPVIGSDNGSSAHFNGYIDELRVSKGIARWTANFTPPDRAYENQDSSGQLIPAISTATAASQLQVTTAGSLNTYGTDVKNYSGFVSKTEVGTIYSYVTYGIRIDNTNSNPETGVIYTDDAVGMTGGSATWDTLFPFIGIKPCVLNNPAGNVNYYLNPANYAQKADTTASDITSGTDGDVMIEIPKMAYSMVTNGNYLYVKVTNNPSPTNGTNEDWCFHAHTRTTAGDKNNLYVGAFLGYTDGSTKLRSLSGKAPTATQTIGTFRTRAQANGTGYDQLAFYPLTLLQCLYLIRYKNRDSQTAIGRGYVDGNASAVNTGGTNTSGMYYGEATGKQQMKFMGIEDFWGNLYYWIDGLFSNATRNMFTAFKSFNDTGSGYTDRGQGATSDIGNYMSVCQGTSATGFIAKAVAGSASTYYSDMAYLFASCLPSFGGSWANASIAGAFRIEVAGSAAGASSGYGGRLMFL